MEQNIVEYLRNGGLVIGDGAFGTMLQAAGLPAGLLPEAWNLQNSEAVRAVHRAYLAAGAMFMTTNTFGGNRLRLRDAGLADQIAAVNRLGIQLAKEAVGDAAWVAASTGSTGQLLEPYGTLTMSEAEEVYGEQMRLLAETEADFILVETQTDITEACCVVRMAKKHTTLPVVCSFAFDQRGRTMMGLRAAQAATQALDAGADIVGANCGDGPEAVRVALEQMRAVTDTPLLAQANAGIPTAGAHGAAVWDVTPEQMAEHAKTFVALGARVVGGCCGTNPDFIRAIAKALKE
jgi:5-methyltetrahydrofolate--homocysteine methyltransferase